MAYIVREITDKRGWKDFLSIPREVYRNDPNWVAPQESEVRRVLDPVKNPYFRNALLKVFVCYSYDKPTCRSVLVINSLHWMRWNKKSAFFGFFESIDDGRAVSSLFTKLEEESKALGAEYLEGPFNPNHYSELGMLTDNFNSSPAFFETYNPPYYPELLYQTGYSELCRIHTRINNNMKVTLEKYFSGPGSHLDDGGVKIRKFNLLRMKRDLEIMRDINNDSFEDNWYFLPLTKEEYGFSAKFLFLVTRPGMIQFAEYKGRTIGVTQCVIDFNALIKSLRGKIKLWKLPQLFIKRNRLKHLVIFTVGIKKTYQHTQVSAVMINAAMKLFRKYSTVSTTWISSENKVVIHISELFEMEPYKHFSIFSKMLQKI
jgi:hypothetical protein